MQRGESPLGTGGQEKMATEYIEKQAAMDKFAEVVASSNHSDFQRAPTWNDAVDIIENFPPADVRPVRRGKWKSSCNGWSAFCSACGEYLPGRVMTPFCPMCGADMGW